MDLVKGLFEGSRLALARSITAVENEYENAIDIMKAIYPKTGNARILGITGAPGAGKSTLTDKVVKHYLDQGKKIGIVAIDPTSPFSGGAILGDRIRMNDLTLNENVFIRSMGTRGSLGGLSKKTADVVKLMDAFGMDLIIIETVGVGQSEVDIVKNADTTLVVLVPGLGDDIQAIKAGILEIGDVFAINKADRDGCDRLNVEIEMMLDLDSREVKWRPPIKRTIASKDQGVDELIEALDEHFEYLEDSGELESRRAERTRDEIIAMINEQIGRYVADKIITSDEFNSQVAAVNERESDPYTVVNGVIEMAFKVLQVDHIGIGVNDLAATKEFYKNALGIQHLPEDEVVEEQKVKVSFFPCGDAELEFLETTTPDGPIGKFIEKNGGRDGIQHVALRVDNIENAIADLMAKGIRMIDEKPRYGAGGSSIAFVHPKATGGVLLELCQRMK